MPALDRPSSAGWLTSDGDGFHRELRLVILLQQMRQMDRAGGHPLRQHHKRDQSADIELIVGGDREIDGERQDATDHQLLERRNDGLDDIRGAGLLEAQPRRGGDADVPLMPLARVERQRLDGPDTLQGFHQKRVLDAFGAETRPPPLRRNTGSILMIHRQISPQNPNTTPVRIALKKNMIGRNTSNTKLSSTVPNT